MSSKNDREWSGFSIYLALPLEHCLSAKGASLREAAKISVCRKTVGTNVFLEDIWTSSLRVCFHFSLYFSLFLRVSFPLSLSLSIYFRLFPPISTNHFLLNPQKNNDTDKKWKKISDNSIQYQRCCCLRTPNIS